MYKCVVRFISSSTMKFKYFFWCSKIHISDYLQFLPVDKFFLLVLNETNEYDIIFFFTWVLSIYFYRKRAYAMTFGMNTYVTRLLYIDSYVYILHEENNAVFILIFKKKKE